MCLKVVGGIPQEKKASHVGGGRKKASSSHKRSGVAHAQILGVKRAGGGAPGSKQSPTDGTESPFRKAGGESNGMETN